MHKKSNTTIEEFGDDNSSDLFWTLVGMIHFIAIIFAFYLMVKCNGRFKFLTFIVVICCPWLYILFTLAVEKGFCKDYYHGKPPKSKK